MNDSEKQFEEWEGLDCDSVDFDELENKLDSELEEQLSDLNELEKNWEKIGSPDTIGDTVKNVVWEQFLNQIGVVAGEDFIKENRGLTLDLRDSAHIQTTENFAVGKIASHNEFIDYQQRYDDWQSNFVHDNNGNVVTHPTRTGKEEATLVRGARTPFDQGRPVGSVERGTDMDHTISAGEIIRDPKANAHLTKEEQIAFANSDVNLNEMDAGQNRSKGDLSMTDWLDNPNKNGQRPNEIFDISDEQDKQYREKDVEARTEYEKLKEKGEQVSIETGKRSQRAEAKRIGGTALRSVVMGLLADLVRKIIHDLVEWFRSENRKLKTFLDSIKKSITTFFHNIKERLKTAANTFATSVLTSIFGPIVGMIKKAWIFLKQGYQSVKEAICFLKDPANKNMSFSLKLMNVGKIVVGALTTGGALVLGEVIEKLLLSIPFFAIQIPLLGSLANIIGILLGAIVSGIIGAFALKLIDRMIAKKLKYENEKQQLEKKNDILKTQEMLINVGEIQANKAKINMAKNIYQRHSDASEQFDNACDSISQNDNDVNELHNSISGINNDISSLLDNI